MINWLETTSNPRIARSNSDLSGIQSAWIKNAGRKWIDLDGRCMQNLPSAYDHMIKAFKLPDYFGRNLNALKDCLTDQDVMQGSAYVVSIAHTSEVLANANKDAFAGLLDTLNVVADELAQPVNEGQPWDRPAIPFHVLLSDCIDDELLLKYPTSPNASPSGQ